MSTLKSFLDRLVTLYNSPVQLAELHLELATYYASEADRLADLIGAITERRRTLALQAKSVSALKLDYELSEEGVEEKKIKIRLDGCEKLLASIRRRLETFDRESTNSY